MEALKPKKRKAQGDPKDFENFEFMKHEKKSNKWVITEVLKESHNITLKPPVPFTQIKQTKVFSDYAIKKKNVSPFKTKSNYHWTKFKSNKENEEITLIEPSIDQNENLFSISSLTESPIHQNEESFNGNIFQTPTLSGLLTEIFPIETPLSNFQKS